LWDKKYIVWTDIYCLAIIKYQYQQDRLQAQKKEINMGNKLHIATHPYKGRKTANAGINHSTKHNAYMNNQVTSTIKLLLIKHETYNSK
jgi:hypothetical protein